MLHFSGSEASSHTVHPHVHDQLLVGVQQFRQSIERLLSDWVETNVNNLKLFKNFEFIEQLDGTIISDATLLKAKLLQLIAEGSGSCHHLGAVILN